jgi:DNA-binding MarR family transcriptional regulator
MIGVNHLISNSELQNLDLIDLVSERHSLVRSISEKAWNNQSEIYISNSEWYIMARIYKRQPSISYVTKNVEISRQAIHKFIQKLSEKGLVEIKNVENNKKEKCIQLTALGEECYEKNEALKAQLENKIAEKIGKEQVNILKDILKLDWGIK